MAQWTAGEQLGVLLAVWNDKEYSANVGLKCPACQKPTLDYHQFNIIDMIAWCRHCRTGIQQGRGKELADKMESELVKQEAADA